MSGDGKSSGKGFLYDQLTDWKCWQALGRQFFNMGYSQLAYAAFKMAEGIVHEEGPEGVLSEDLALAARACDEFHALRDRYYGHGREPLSPSSPAPYIELAGEVLKGGDRNPLDVLSSLIKPAFDAAMDRGEFMKWGPALSSLLVEAVGRQRCFPPEGKVTAKPFGTATSNQVLSEWLGARAQLRFG